MSLSIFPNVSNISVVDIILIIFIGYFVIKEFNRGLLNGVNPVVSLFFGILISNIFNENVEIALVHWITNDSARSLLSYLLIFGITYFGVFFVLRKSHKIIGSKLSIKKFNKSLGAILGLMKSLIIISLTIFITNKVRIIDDWHEGLKSISFVYSGCSKFNEWIIDSGELSEYQEKLEKKLSEYLKAQKLDIIESQNEIDSLLENTNN